MDRHETRIVPACLAAAILALGAATDTDAGRATDAGGAAVGGGTADRGGAALGGGASVAEQIVNSETAGACFLHGRRIDAPYRIAIDGQRVVINGIDAEPAGAPDGAASRPLAPETAAALPAIRETTARAHAAADSLRRAGAADPAIVGHLERLFRENRLVRELRVLPTGGLEVAWRDVPGWQHVPIDVGRDVASAPAIDEAARLRATQSWLSASLARGDFYAAGVGYRVSLSGALADSMDDAIARFRASPSETLAVGGRTYRAFAAELRAAWREEVGR